MLTIKQITDDTEKVIRGLEKKHFEHAKEVIAKVIELNDKRKASQALLDNNLAEINTTSKTIGALIKSGKKEEAEAAKARVAEIKEANKSLEEAKEGAANEMQALLYTIPNIPYDEVPEGKTAEDNVVVKMGGMETELPKNALPHWELAKKYDIIDFDLGVKITGAGFPVYKGKGARLQRALINFFLDEAREAGYTEIMPPTVVNAASGYGTGQLPDKEGQMYHCEVDDLYLIPTAEVPVTNIYRDVILDEKDLPIKNCAYTECFRRAAGSYGKEARGLNRLHEFSKVELVRIDKPEAEALWKRFSVARTTFNQARRKWAQARDNERTAAKEAKEAIIAEANELKDSTAWGETSRKFNDLMDRWKKAGRAGRNEDDELWAKFREAADTFFNARQADRDQINSSEKENLAAKEALLVKAEALVPVKNDAEAKKARQELAKIQEERDQIG